VPVLGSSDAHGTVYHLGPLSRAVQSYGALFRSINTHLLSSEPLCGDLNRDKAAIYSALKAGRSFIGYERLGAVSGFCFWARSAGVEATMGETLTVNRALDLHVKTPAPARLRLLRDGQVIAQARGRELALMTPKPGVYRAEAFRRYAGQMRGWIFGNPIYVR
jgi:hypothetical protein